MRSGLFGAWNWVKTPATAAVLAASVMVNLAGTSVEAQTLTVLHAFSGPDGNAPFAGLSTDPAGNLYGTTSLGGNNGCFQGSGCGTVFKLSRSGSGWVLTTLYQFQGNHDGWGPMARVLFGPNGSLYGTTQYGGYYSSPTDVYGHGTVFKLTPPAHSCGSVSCPWTEAVLYRFTGGEDGGNPQAGDLTFDQAGNIYGTTLEGGIANPSCAYGSLGCGVVFELTQSSGGWTESVIYRFTGGDDGDTPNAGVVFDRHGSLYGTATQGGSHQYGTLYQLTPSGSGWAETTLHAFQGLNDGSYPEGVVFDGAGNLYGFADGSPQLQSSGTAFELTPSGSGWSFSVLNNFPMYDTPWGTPALRDGDIYGALYTGGVYGFGGVFELMPGSGGWSFTTLYSFMAQNDGSTPFSTVLVDAKGNVYGTASGGGAHSDGVVFEVIP